MAETFTEAQGYLFAEMDGRAREVVEKKFRVRLDSAQSSESQQAAWEVYQNATLKLIKALQSHRQKPNRAGAPTAPTAAPRHQAWPGSIQA